MLRGVSREPAAAMDSRASMAAGAATAASPLVCSCCSGQPVCSTLCVPSSSWIKKMSKSFFCIYIFKFLHNVLSLFSSPFLVDFSAALLVCSRKLIASLSLLLHLLLHLLLLLQQRGNERLAPAGASCLKMTTSSPRPAAFLFCHV